MRKLFLIILAVTLFTLEGRSDVAEFLGMVSPKQRDFLREHPQAAAVLTNAVGEAARDGGRRLQIYYFYSADRSLANAGHYYPSEGIVGVTIREDQSALDEYLCLLYEVLNSMGEPKFREIFDKAEKGDLGRRDFAVEILRVEFKAVLRMRQLLLELKFKNSLTKKSDFYKAFLNCPDDFDKFLEYKKKIANGEDPTKSYEQQFDLLKK